ncbi:MAG: glycosyltransferase [Planctomycetes bacterium]|nr:glycosyltransferase [Planctomycetota bacterium]
MKSLVLCPYLPFPPNHGGRLRSAMLCTALCSLGDVTLAAPVPASEEAEAHRLAKANGCTLASLGPPATATSLTRKLGAWLTGRSEILERRWTGAARTRVAELLARHGFDLVALDSSFTIPLVPKACPVPLVIQLHNLEFAVLRRSAGHAPSTADAMLRRIESRFIARAERRTADRARLAIAVSDVDRALATALAPRARITVIENSIDLAVHPQLPPTPSGAPLLLLVGSFAYPPNLDAAQVLVTQHLPVLRARWPDLRVRLIGHDPDGGLRAWHGRPGLEILGFVDDLRPHYAAATALYAPIRDGGGTRIKVIEAMALGRPVISTAVGVEGLAVERGVHWLPCETPTEGVASVQSVLDGAAASLVRAGRALVEGRHAHTVTVPALAAVIFAALRNA